MQSKATLNRDGYFFLNSENDTGEKSERTNAQGTYG
ncbi:hypothetical protein AAZX31_13G096600 [Glycine max]